MASALGIDISTQTGVVLIDEPEGAVFSWELTDTKHKGLTRAIHIAEQLAGILPVAEADVVVIEGYGYANTNTLALLVEIGTLCRYTVFEGVAPWVPVFVMAPTSLKKFITGKGNVKKDQMRLSVYKRWGFENESDNIVDAYALAQAGLAKLAEGMGVTKREQEALDKMSLLA